jgi:two-component system response regulator RegX3
METKAKKPRILVVEDEANIRSGLCDLLAYHGYDPRGVESGEEGLECALGESFDLVILDLMLPGLSGLDVCRELREREVKVPVLMLTAKGAEDDIVNGLKAGADDYVAKPFSLRELMARVEALLRRSGKLGRDEEFTFGPWQVDAQGLRAWRGETKSELTRREVDLLALFTREAGRVVSRRTLLSEVWGLSNVEELETRTVDVHIAKLRKKIDLPGDPSLIETVRGAGYRGVA